MPPELEDPVEVARRARSKNGDGFPATDLGNAERLVAAHGDDLRYAPNVGWLVWDGRRWKRDVDGEVIRRMKLTARSMLAAAAALDDDEQRKRLRAHEARSEAEARLRAAVSLAESDEDVIVLAEKLDADPMVLNCANGVLHLEVGELLPHDRELAVTKLAPVDYNPDARSKLWDEFLRQITGGDNLLASFLQRAAGYSLTGDTGEEKLFFAHGPTATGKSSFLEGLRAALGEYAATADFETFLARRGDSGIRNDVARLAGTRLVVSIEVDEGKRLAEGLIKILTGGDTVSARFLYREAFEFRPRFKLWLAANQRPPVSADDSALWRRIVQVPFVEVIPEARRDPTVKQALRHDPVVRAAILAWAVEGCREWRQAGLAVPERVLAYTAEYRYENDPLADWLETACLFRPDVYAIAKQLRASYEKWAESNGEKPVSNGAWGKALKARKCTRDRDGQARIWHGIALRAVTDDQQ